MRQEWMNDDGWFLSLFVREGQGASLQLSHPDIKLPVLYRSYEWFETHRAEDEARGLVQLGRLQEVARVRR